MKRPLKKLVFVEPKSTHLHIYSRVCIPRLGSVLLGTIMRAKGYDVRVYIEDIQAIDMNEVLSADLVAVSAITSTAPQSYKLADASAAPGPSWSWAVPTRALCPTRACSTPTSSCAARASSPSRSWSTPSSAGDGFDKIQNLSYRTDDGRIVSNPERPKIPNLDVNPIPDYHLIEGWKPGGVISVATSRGCPFSCTFCSVPGMYGHAFRTHSIDRVLQELELHKGNMYTFFADDIFTANKKRVKELLRQMIARNLTPPWGAQVRTETVDDPELLAMMRDSNCFNVYVGFESINPRTLKLFQKKQDLAKIERSIDRFHEHKIRIHGMFVVGSDEDDVETIDATAEFALKHDIDSDPVHDPDAHPGLARLGHALRQGRQVRDQPELDLLRRPPCRAPAAAHEPLGAADRPPSAPWRSSTPGGGSPRSCSSGDLYYATIRYWGKKMLRRLVEGRGQPRLRRLAEDPALRRGARVRARLGEDGRPAGRAAAGQARAAAPAVPRRARRDGGAAGRGRRGARPRRARGETIDCLITPIVKRAEQGTRGVLHAPHRGRPTP